MSPTSDDAALLSQSGKSVESAENTVSVFKGGLVIPGVLSEAAATGGGRSLGRC